MYVKFLYILVREILSAVFWNVLIAINVLYFSNIVFY